ncbi:DUF5305 domain-containing protein [Natronomonas gomsonensis]|uniref:DUF5305 domain-containing protein n=1 Tax=Natronomonas gomsonensis TaxID=1046043 RepID=UPI0015BEE658|nr:DUF5305 domain-containing protein [Natronomonas gomsonensis]
MWGKRAKVVVADYAVVIAAVLVVVLLVGGALTYTTNVEPGTETEQRTVSEWRSVGGYTHASTIQTENRVFPVGETLEDRSLYYTQVGPELDGQFRYGFEAPDGELTVESTTTLVIRSVSEGEEGDTDELWRIEEPLGTTSETVAPGELATTSFTINVTEVLAEIEGVREDLGASPGEASVRVISEVEATGTAAGGDATDDANYTLTLDPGSDTYSVSGPSGETESHPRTETVSVERSYGPIRSALGPLLVVLSLVGLAGIAVGRYRGAFEVTDAERRTLAFAAERREFDQWISRGAVSTAADDKPRVRIDNLEDLVDIAIDTDARVIEDVGKHRYYVLGESLCYEFEPPQHVNLRELE